MREKAAPQKVGLHRLVLTKKGSMGEIAPPKKPRPKCLVPSKKENVLRENVPPQKLMPQCLVRSKKDKIIKEKATSQKVGLQCIVKSKTVKVRKLAQSKYSDLKPLIKKEADKVPVLIPEEAFKYGSGLQDFKKEIQIILERCDEHPLIKKSHKPTVCINAVSSKGTSMFKRVIKHRCAMCFHPTVRNDHQNSHKINKSTEKPSGHKSILKNKGASIHSKTNRRKNNGVIYNKSNINSSKLLGKPDLYTKKVSFLSTPQTSAEVNTSFWTYIDVNTNSGQLSSEDVKITELEKGLIPTKDVKTTELVKMLLPPENVQAADLTMKFPSIEDAKTTELEKALLSTNEIKTTKLEKIPLPADNVKIQEPGKSFEYSSKEFIDFIHSYAKPSMECPEVIVEESPSDQEIFVPRNNNICKICEDCGEGFDIISFISRNQERDYRKPKYLECSIIKPNKFDSYSACSKTSKCGRFVHCTNCPMIYSRSDHLLSHMKIHQSNTPVNLICKFCFQVLKNPSNVRRHFRSVHESKSAKSFSPDAENRNPNSYKYPDFLLLEEEIKSKNVEKSSKIVVRVPTATTIDVERKRYEEFTVHHFTSSVVHSRRNSDFYPDMQGSSDDDCQSGISIENEFMYPEDEHNYCLPPESQGDDVSWELEKRVRTMEYIDSLMLKKEIQKSPGCKSGFLNYALNESLLDYFQDLSMMISKNEPVDVQLNHCPKSNGAERITGVIEETEIQNCVNPCPNIVTNMFVGFGVPVIVQTVSNAKSEQPFEKNHVVESQSTYYENPLKFSGEGLPSFIVDSRYGNVIDPSPILYHHVEEVSSTGDNGIAASENDHRISVSSKSESNLPEPSRDSDYLNLKRDFKTDNHEILHNLLSNGSQNKTFILPSEILKVPSESATDTHTLPAQIFNNSLQTISVIDTQVLSSRNSENDYCISLSPDIVSNITHHSDDFPKNLKFGFGKQTKNSDVIEWKRRIKQGFNRATSTSNKNSKCLKSTKNKRNTLMKSRGITYQRFKAANTSFINKLACPPVVVLERLKEPINYKPMMMKSKPALFNNVTSSAPSAGSIISLPTIFVCSDCDLLFPTSSLLDIHKNFFSGNIHYPCRRCGNAFPSKPELHSHRCNNAKRKKQVCDKCGLDCVHYQDLKRHKANNCSPMTRYDMHTLPPTTNSSNFQLVQDGICNLCSLAFKSYSAYKMHFMHIHPFLCILCQAQCHDSFDLLTHMRMYCPGYFNSKTCLNTVSQHNSSTPQNMRDVLGTDSPKTNFKTDTFPKCTNTVVQGFSPNSALRTYLKPIISTQLFSSLPPVSFSTKSEFLKTSKCGNQLCASGDEKLLPKVNHVNISPDCLAIPNKCINIENLNVLSHMSVPINATGIVTNKTHKEVPKVSKKVLVQQESNSFMPVFRKINLIPKNTASHPESCVKCQFNSKLKGPPIQKQRYHKHVENERLKSEYFKEKLDATETANHQKSDIPDISVSRNFDYDVTLEGRYKCSSCVFTYKNMQTLWRHEILCHLNRDDLKSVKCSLCPAIFNQPSQLMKHAQHHLDRNSMICPLCAMVFRQIDSLRFHLKCRHLHPMNKTSSDHVCTFEIQIMKLGNCIFPIYKCLGCDIMYTTITLMESEKFGGKKICSL